MYVQYIKMFVDPEQIIYCTIIVFIFYFFVILLYLCISEDSVYIGDENGKVIL